ncbi:PepSY domain-containing protein [Parerythrobacter jejuensis]|uniref:PepSY domain-containing protein n=1 Tax=Parerythrobacter jejuensis TaxID=795812 RepID=A0A845AVI3_9SPHN|nr:PepSY domain-containing protein [Parerythrobacter jejuensis]MXP30433.1 hypothetical protein [Parerythrobacter jejuensis]MXP33193.1 hypothetical protein [Parerythrobacter jejuensis]
MSRAKTRNFLVVCHLLLAGLLAPLFFLVAVTGGLYLWGNKGETVETALSVPAEIAIQQDAPDVEDSVRAVLAANDLPTDFEYLRMRPGSITTRPTSRDFVVLTDEDGQWSAALHQPNLQYRMMELHKGHGPQMFKWYQIFAAISLFLVVFGGLIVGFMAPGYRNKTIGSLAFGTIVFVLLAFVL